MKRHEERKAKLNQLRYINSEKELQNCTFQPNYALSRSDIQDKS